MNFRQLGFISGTVDNPELCSRVLREHAMNKPVKAKSWHDMFNRVADWIDAGMPEKTPFNVFVKGNGKLPFQAFSSLPGFNFCPGAGDCLNWCYSYGSWRNPPAFCRQLQNSLLMIHKRTLIKDAWGKLPNNQHVRLYVDGDFGTVEQLRFWMEQCETRKDLKVYGYSKSFQVFLSLHDSGFSWPNNYVLNLSGGHKYGSDIVNKMKELPITRGEFIGIDINRTVRHKDHGTPEVNRSLRAAAKAMGLGKVFTCPGKCGECTIKEHACGSRRFDGIPIVIAVH